MRTYPNVVNEVEARLLKGEGIVERECSSSSTRKNEFVAVTWGSMGQGAAESMTKFNHNRC